MRGLLDFPFLSWVLFNNFVSDKKTGTLLLKMKYLKSKTVEKSLKQFLPKTSDLLVGTRSLKIL